MIWGGPVSPTAPAPGLDPSGDLERILHLDDATLNKIDVARVNLLVARELFPDLDAGAYCAALDRLAEDARRFAALGGGDRNDPDYCIRALNTALYRHQGFRYAELGGAKDAAAFHRDPRNLFLNGVLDRKQGTCISMPVLYIAVADRLGYPVRGVNANDHFFCRWDDGRAVSNIEATSEGGWSADEDYIRDMKVTPGQIRSGAAMRSLTRRELIGNFFFARAAHYAVTGRPIAAERDLLKVIACNPRDADGYANLAQMYARAARRLGKAVALVAAAVLFAESPDLSARHYRAREGRFLQRDPIGFRNGEYNLYVYTGNNPVNRVDPLGLSWLSWLFGYGYSGPVADAFDAEIGFAVIKKSNEIAEGASIVWNDGIWESRRLMVDAMAERYALIMIHQGTGTAYIVAANDLVGTTGLMEGVYGVDVAAETRLTGVDRTQRTIMGASQTVLGVTGGAGAVSRVRSPGFIKPSGPGFARLAQWGGSAKKWATTFRYGGKSYRLIRLNPRSINTPHGLAIQANTTEALEALQNVQGGQIVFRRGQFGVQNTFDAQYWSIDNPSTTPNYAIKLGMPGSPTVRPDWIMGGVVKPGSPVITRPAPGIGLNSGGNMEAVVPPGGVRIEFFCMPD
jgi:regulator of sirC expression with transglutaminase-like and TPR domain